MRLFSIYGQQDPKWEQMGRSGQMARSGSQKRGVDPKETLWWVGGVLITMFGGVWATVPLYKMYCQSLGEGTAVKNRHKQYAPPPDMSSPAAKRLITVDFRADVHDTLPWEFKPQQKRLTVTPGETALAFYRAKNTTDRPIIGVSIYHMIPPESGLYFNKIQCFCFDEQLLNPGEEVDMPLLFFIDPEIMEDPRFQHIDQMSLQYIFFESDSDLPEEYNDLMATKAQKTDRSPLAVEAPAPKASLAQL